MHDRLEPVRHFFKYPLYMHLIDLSELEDLGKKFSFFGYNKFRPLSIYDKDYLGPQDLSLMSKVRELLKEKSYKDEVKRVELLTTPRYFGYVFNPASFFYCYGEDDKILALILEVNNTFGERHVYVMDSEFEVGENKYYLPKEFYVSPFNDISGDYDCATICPNGAVDIKLNIVDKDKTIFRSRVWGKTKPLSWNSFLSSFYDYPFTAVLNLPRITWQAAKLHFSKKLPVQYKPAPSHSRTRVIAKPSMVERLSIKAIDKVLKSLSEGSLELVFPDGQVNTYGTSDSRPATIEVYDYSFFSRLAFGGDIALGEAYCEGLFETEDLQELISFFAKNVDAFHENKLGLAKFSELRAKFNHWLKRNTKDNSRKNIHAHYDLSNDLFERFLDPTMMYSSAIFETGEETLEEAQIKKLTRIIKKAEIKSQDHVLEIGCGWGGFAIEAVNQTGCRVTCLTLSTEQKRLADERIAAAGFSDKIDVRICDYRDIAGKFDKIVSIEMLEAVGHQYFDTFFSKCDGLLKEGGKAVLQVITIPHNRFTQACDGIDWIQKYIFPGSTIPSIEALEQSMSRVSKFQVTDSLSIGQSYATTLKLWREEFENNWPEISQFGFDEKFRCMWNYYLAYCEAGFATSAIDNYHLVLERVD